MTQHGFAHVYGSWGAALTADTQLAAAQRMIDAATLPLSSVGAASHPPDFLARPTNALGAKIRVAYWLAVGARPKAAGQAPNPSLLYKAKIALADAQGSSGFQMFDLTLASPDAQIDSVLYEGERAAASAGRTDVASILNSIRGQPSALGSSSGLPAALGFTPEGRTKLATAVTVGGVSLVTLAVGAVVLYFAWPFLGIARAGASRVKDMVD